MTTAIPSRAAIVIIGGGIIGCSTAYHLALNGATDVVLLERAQLTTGSTFHAAGLVGQLRSSRSITELLKYSVELYDSLETVTGQATGWKRNGGLRLASTPDRLIELQRAATTARSFGLNIDLLSPSEAQELWPLMNVDNVMGAAFLADDGQVGPSDITQALAIGARNLGVRIVEGCDVTDISVVDGQVTGVDTADGAIECDVVVNCAGQWARSIGQMAGVSVPLVSVEHQYLITEPIDGITTDLPTMRDPDNLVYFKEEVGGLVMGGYEPNPQPWGQNGIPTNFNGRLLDPDWPQFEQLMISAIDRVPSMETVGIRQLVNGPESFTPDGNFILGEAPEVRSFFVGAGFNAFGIAAAGGAGRALAEWIVGGEPSTDLWPVDIRRFGSVHQDVDWVRSRTLEMYAKHYTIAWPHEEHESGRPRLTSALYERLTTAGASFGSKLGWERPNWFGDPTERPRDSYSFGRQNWFDAVGVEHAACRNAVAIFDQSSFAKFTVKGRGAEAALQWLCSNDMSKPPGSVTYTQLLNTRGGIECDLTVSRLDDHHFYVVTGTGFRTRDLHWINSNLVGHADVEVADVTEDIAVLSLMGPRARDVLQSATATDVSDSAVPFGTATLLDIAGQSVTALRLTYVGELGWELHMHRDCAGAVYESLLASGSTHGIRDAGYRAIESLRLEKGYRAWGSDLGPDHTPLEAGLSWAVKLGTDTDFIGRTALELQKTQGTTKRLGCFTVDDPSIVLLGRETIFRDGKRAGWLTSGGWGYTVEKNIAYGYVSDADGVNRAYLGAGSYELEVATRRVPCQVHTSALYDPKMLRIKS